MNPTTPSPRPLPDQSRQPLQQPTRQSTQDAAANVIREQINSIYSGGSAEATPHTTPVARPTATTQPAAAPAEPTPATTPPAPAQPTQPATTQSQSSPTTATHGLRTAPPAPAATIARPQGTAQPARQQPQATPADWQQYHSAWQKYYQLYYERYYANHLQAQTAQPTEQATSASAETLDLDAESPEKAAMRELRTKIRNKVRASATTVKKSRHFVPILAGVTVFLVFMFLQYNRILFGMVAAYTSPGNIDPQNIIVDPGTNVAVGPEPRLIIPKINVDAPIVYGAAPDVKSQNRAMEQGVAHFAVAGANAMPGQVGNTVLAAHSSNDAFAAGDYKFVFAQNEKLHKGDLIYTYSITNTEVVMPHEVNKVQLTTDKPMLTLVSCVPIGTAEKRLLIFAEQINPDPKGAESPKQSSQSAPQSTDIPGNPSPTLLERLFGAS